MIKELLERFKSRPSMPTTAIGQAFFSPLSSGGAPPRLGTRELLEAYSQMPWLRAIVNKIGKAVGTTTWELFLDGSESKGLSTTTKLQRADAFTRRTILNQSISKNLVRPGLKEIEEHPLLDLLIHPNEAMTGSALFLLTQAHIDLVGEAFWLLERDGLGTPMAIWPLPPDWIRNFPTNTNPWYRIQIGNNAITMKIPVTELIAFIDPDPLNPYGRGTGLAKSLGDELQTDEYAAKHLKSFFHNSARPDLIISADNLSRADTATLEQKWTEQHQGFWRAFKPQFLNRKVDVKEIGQNFQHMQMVELRKSERDTIIQVFGIPPEKLGIVNESKRSTISAADLFWQRDILEPRLEFIRECLQVTLVPQFDKKLILNYISPVIRDDEHRLEVMKSAPHWFTQNEWRFEAQKPLLEDGDDLMQPLNATRTDSSGEPVNDFQMGIVEPPESETEPSTTPPAKEATVVSLGDFKSQS